MVFILCTRVFDDGREMFWGSGKGVFSTVFFNLDCSSLLFWLVFDPQKMKVGYKYKISPTLYNNKIDNNNNNIQ